MWFWLSRPLPRIWFGILWLKDGKSNVSINFHSGTIGKKVCLFISALSSRKNTCVFTNPRSSAWKAHLMRSGRRLSSSRPSPCSFSHQEPGSCKDVSNSSALIQGWTCWCDLLKEATLSIIFCLSSPRSLRKVTCHCCVPSTQDQSLAQECPQ